jgi:acetaldehyde dehydrogenase (acetylating)
MNKKLKVGILGSGNIGTDLLIKILRSEFLECTIFVGRNLSSNGMRKASSLNVRVSDKSIDAFIENPRICDLVFDATSASSHIKHAPILKNLGIKVIDMTPSQIGKMCIPAINIEECIKEDNINMVTCGGQASIPVAYTLKRNMPEIKYIEVISTIASRSAGLGTRANIDEYVYNTEKCLKMMSKCDDVKVILNLNPANPCIDMQTSIFAKVDFCDTKKLIQPIKDIEKVIQKYTPGYKVVIYPTFENGRIAIMIRVKGVGDYLPNYAGNLDIINCAAIEVAEKISQEGR